MLVSVLIRRFRKESFPLGWVILTALILSGCASPPPKTPAIRVGVIGGMMRTGLWPELARTFEAQSRYRVELAGTGNRDVLAEAFRAGKLDLIAIHAGDVAAKLASDGHARNLRPWARNEFVILGPSSDPARIRGMLDGAAALARIASAQAPFVDYQNSGPHGVASALWSKAGVRPEGAWLLKDDSESSEQALEFASKNRAYLILGRIPAVQTTNTHDKPEILVQGDPAMHRLFVVAEANPKRFPQGNVKGAHALAQFLLSSKAQDFLLAFTTNVPPGLPLFYPVNRR